MIIIKKHKYINKEDLKEEVCLIQGTKMYYIDKKGNVYKDCGNNWMVMKLYKNKTNNYMYLANLKKMGAPTTRIHRLVAIAFIPNPNNKPVVNHKNGIKWDNRIENLEWNTISENTKHSFDNGFQVNDKGYFDSQSFPVYAINLESGLILDFGSIKECSRALGVSDTTIARQCKGETKTKPRCGYKFIYQ